VRSAASTARASATLSCACRGFEFAVGDRLLTAQFLLARKVEPRADAVGLGAVQRGLGSRNLLRTRAGLEFGESRLRPGEFGATQGDLLFLLGIVEPRDELAGRDAVALGDEALRHAAGDFETELRVRHLDVAGEDEVAGVDAIVAGTSAEP